MRRRAAIGAAAAAGYAAAVLAVDPFRTDLPGCPFLVVSGWHCPGCGSTRAVHLLLHGDVAGAVATNALVVPFVAFLAARWLALVVPARVPRWVRDPTTIPQPAVLAVGATFVAFAVARNVPALAALAP